MPDTYTINGGVNPPGGADPGGIKVQAFDRDLPSLERRTGTTPPLLGEAITDAKGRFEITYALEQFQGGERTSTLRRMLAFRRTSEISADLSFRVFDRAGQELPIKSIEALHREYRSDQIIFNVPNPVEVTISLDESRESVGTSEYELLIAQLAPVIQDVSLVELTDEDTAFLSNELGLEQQRDVQQRIEWLRRCAVMAQRTNLPIEAFYGWGRKDLPAQLSELAAVPVKDLAAVLDKLAGLPAEKLRDGLLAAVAENILPAALRARGDEIVRQLVRGSQDLLHVNARLLDAETGSPLAGHSVTTLDKDAEDANLGLDIANQEGMFFFTYYQPRGLPANAAARRFSFKVMTPGGDALPESTPTAISPNRLGSEVLSVKIKVPKPPAASLAEHLQGVKALAPPAVSTWLKGSGISTFADIRRKGGLGNVPGMPAGDPGLIHRLNALADLDRISASVQVSTVLLGKGYDSVLAIADTPYSEFISLVSDETTALTKLEVARLHVMATTQTELLNNILMRMAADKANGFELPDQSENPAGGNK